MTDLTNSSTNPVKEKSTEPKLDALPPDELKANAESLAHSIREGLWMFRGRMLFELEEDRAKRWRNRPDRRIVECQRNAQKEGRGKHIFIICRETFERIVVYIESSRGYSAEEVARILYTMYYDGTSFKETDPSATVKTVNRHLNNAFQALDIQIGSWKKPSVSTIRTSHVMLKDAEAAQVNLSPGFLVV
ncbi:MAG: hypothetical protein IIA59_08895 [Candidatus Marinimicrobia bacterium]|nr:hypothetical protein [Candidatus Neomarinimicrobiota bacterium]